MNQPFAIEVESLTPAYGSRRALDDVSFAVAPSEIFGLLGPNGGGKTTLFRVLATLLSPTAGRARPLGEDTTRTPPPAPPAGRLPSPSGGLRRRVESAKGLLHGPKLLLRDEPSSGLDAGA